MNLDPLSFALSQINYLVANLNKKNYKTSSQEINQLVLSHSVQADRHLLRCLFSYVDFSTEGSKANSKDYYQSLLLIQEYTNLLTKPCFVSNLCFAIDHPLQIQKTLKPNPQLFTQLSKILKLSKVQEVTFGLALLSSEIPETRSYATQFFKLKLPDLIRTYIDSDSATGSQEGGLHDTSPEILHLILTNLLSGPKEQCVITQDVKETLLKTLRKDFTQDLVPVVLAPLLYSGDLDLPMDKNNQENHSMSTNLLEGALAELILEVGYGFCATAEECQTSLRNFGVREITAVAVARALGVMCRSHSGLDNQVSLQNIQNPSSLWNDKEKSDNNLPTTWSIENFVQALHDVIPALNWKEVIYEFDHPSFIIKDRPGFKLIITSCRLGFQWQSAHVEHFPIDLIYRHWKNSEGQLSFISQCLRNSDIFCFSDFPYHSVNIEVLKALPESDNKDISTWKCLELIEILLYLSDNCLYSQVQELFKFPVQHCPDILVLALIQMGPPLCMLRQDLLTNLLPIFLGNHVNSGIILHHAWHSQNTTVRPIVMHVMADWYMRGENDQTRLSRILDVAQDLKALSLLLNAQSFIFVIDLACLASRRGYLKLEKWLSDKIREHGEQFISACVKFLQRRAPQVMGGVVKDDLPKSSQLPAETLTTMLSCLQQFAISSAYSGSGMQELNETIIAMISNCNVFLNKQRQPPPGVLRTPSALEAAFAQSSNIAGQLFSSPSVDNLPMSSLSASLGSSLAAMNLGAVTVPSSAAFNIPSGLGQLVSTTPSSPSRLLGGPSSAPGGPSQSPFPIIQPLTPQLHMGTMGNQAVGPPNPSLLTGNVGVLGRLPNSLEKTRASTTDLAGMIPDLAQGVPVSKEIEDEANSYFQRIYNHPPHPTLSIDEVLDMLKKFQESPNKREREVFNCMLRNLFEEYRFFPEYPEKELHITAQLFGGIVEHGIVLSYWHLGLALRYILDALKKPHGSKMYYFGIAALDRFKHRLKDYPQYCQHVSSISHFNDFPPQLVEYVDFGSRQLDPATRSVTSLPSSISAPATAVQAPQLTSMMSPITTAASTAGKTITPTTVTTTTTIAKATTSTSVSGRPSIANATNIDTLLVATEKETAEINPPPENLQDKIAFIFNNLSQMNLQSKCEEMRELMSEDYWSWVSQYLVLKRASIEPNFHTLYSNFLDMLKMSEVNNMVAAETFRNIKVLLRSDKSIANFSDRTLLKNLGHWLGMMTLSKNKPILANDIDFKNLIIEAFHKGQQEMLFVIPFIAKILESCAKSKVFKPPNPWLMAIMNLLAELHQEPDLKLNLKFEIEVLCKTLTLDLQDLKPHDLLKNPDKLEELTYQLSQPRKKTEILQPLPPLQLQQIGLSEELTHMAIAAVSPPHVNLITGTSTPTSTLTTIPQEPRFNYMDIDINPGGLAPHITINGQLTLYMTHPQLKQLVRPAIERALQEWLHPVVDRATKIALTTCEQIVKKDFAVDPDETRMRLAAHHMVRNLTASMAMITCRDHLIVAITSNLKQSFLSALRVNSPTPQQKEMLEQAASITAHENVELACAFIQKTAVEKAVPEMDKRLATECELRKHARTEGRRYCDSLALTYQAERMPEQIRLKVGGVTSQQMAVYEEFGRTLPGFLPLGDGNPSNLLIPKPVASYSDDLTNLYDKMVNEIDHLMQSVISSHGVMNPHVVLMRAMLETVVLTRNMREAQAAVGLLQKAIEGLLEGYNQLSCDPEVLVRFRDSHLIVLKTLQDARVFGPQWTNKQVARLIMECREDFRYNIEAVDILIRSHLVNIPQLDILLTQAMDNGQNFLAIGFAMSLVQLYLVDDRASGILSENDLYNTIEMLARLASHGRTVDGLPSLMEVLRSMHDPTSTMGSIERAPGGPTAHIHSGISQARDSDDPPGLMEKTEYLLREWVNLYHASASGRDSGKAFGILVQQMNVHGILKTDDLITRFFRLSTQVCVDLCYRALTDQHTAPSMTRAKCFHSLDAFVRLIALLVRHSGDNNNTTTKINLLNKVLGIVAGVLMQDHEVRSTDFQQLPYHRIFIMLFLELNVPDHVLEAINYQILAAFCHTLHILRPSKAPGFAYAWLELVSHRVFIGRMLAITPQQKASECWGMYAQLLIDLFKFLAPFLRNAELAKPVTILYKGTLRVLLVLLHDFPEFLCEYHYGFCDVIPPNCIQMRNLILSAFPRNMRLPDPFTPNLKVDLLPEITLAPRVLTNYVSMIQPITFKKDLDSYLKTRAPVTFLSELRGNLQVSNEPGLRYNIPLMNALVLYVGTQAIQLIRAKGVNPNMSTITHSSHMDIFQNLAVALDTEGRYLFLNAISNQLRYPNSHTHYFSCTLLYLFAETNTEAIQEQITRVLLERLIVNRPHPWGLLITFIELIKNPSYKFWNHEFVHCAPEIEKLFESVARSCMVQKQSQPPTESEIAELNS